MAPSPDRARQTAIPLWASLSALAVLVAVGGLMIWGNMAEKPPAGDRPPTVGSARLPVRADSDAGPRSPLHSVKYAEENGKKVVKILVVAGGDELVIDAKTGRLLATRPAPAEKNRPFMGMSS